MDKFINLHVHTDSSTLDGFGTKEARFKYVIEVLDQSALAITDHGTMSGIYDFWNIAQQYNVKPLLGVEIYFVNNLKKREKKEKRYHLVLLAKNLKGYKNIMQIQYIAHKYGFYKKPRVDRDVLKNYSDNVICLSACAANDISVALADNDIALAKRRIDWYKETYGDDFYLEFQPYQSEKLRRIDIKLYKLWKKIHHIKAVITSDAHYIQKEQSEDHAKLLLINTRGKVNDNGSNKFSFNEHNLYLHSRNEIINEGFQTGYDKNDIEQWCDTTIEVADKIEAYDIRQQNYIVPPIPEFMGADLNKILRKKCLEGLKQKKLFDDIYMKRLAYELKIIYNAGFSSYFLVVADIVNWAKREGIYVGPSRGSAGASLTAYALGITAVDPIKHDLQFERFLNPERLGGKVLKFIE